MLGVGPGTEEAIDERVTLQSERGRVRDGEHLCSKERSGVCCGVPAPVGWVYTVGCSQCGLLGNDGEFGCVGQVATWFLPLKCALVGIIRCHRGPGSR